MSKPEPSEEEKEQRIQKFRKIINFRKITGLAISLAGIVVLIFGLQKTGAGAILLSVNGCVLIAYGIYMRLQALRYLRMLGEREND